MVQGDEDVKETTRNRNRRSWTTRAHRASASRSRSHSAVRHPPSHCSAFKHLWTYLCWVEDTALEKIPILPSRCIEPIAPFLVIALRHYDPTLNSCHSKAEQKTGWCAATKKIIRVSRLLCIHPKSVTLVHGTIIYYVSGPVSSVGKQFSHIPTKKKKK